MYSVSGDTAAAHEVGWHVLVVVVVVVVVMMVVVEGWSGGVRLWTMAVLLATHTPWGRKILRQIRLYWRI
ncbi:hypothetical protein E2C01_033228 [Portunus trituberculatus]|uniref:Uncharacterized protein n=1 Tax=Portunus trituberculatus TaxID=210409 RepID=A0A5B7F3M5_PORTR|nr:hypothetical protein [Portunus trituberculatus]